MSDHTIVVIWVIKTLFKSGFSVYSCHIFLISSASVQSLPFLSFSVPILAWKFPLISPVFLMRSLVFPTQLFFSIFFFFLHYSLKKNFFSLLAFLWNSTFTWVYLSPSPLPSTSLLSAIYKASSDNHFAFLISFSLEWFWSLSSI